MTVLSKMSECKRKARGIKHCTFLDCKEECTDHIFFCNEHYDIHKKALKREARAREDKSKDKIRQARYRAKNRDKIRAKNRERYWSNPESSRRYNNFLHNRKRLNEHTAESE